jgi:hypothetical protein
MASSSTRLINSVFDGTDDPLASGPPLCAESVVVSASAKRNSLTLGIGLAGLVLVTNTSAARWPRLSWIRTFVKRLSAVDGVAYSLP